MKKIWKFLARNFIKILISDVAKNYLRKKWDEIDDFDYFWSEFVKFIKNL